MASDPIRLAIIGSGLAGAALANALAHHSHLQIHIFEAAPVVSERGAAVALATNTQEALRHIFGASNAVSAEEVMSRAQAVPMKSSRLAMVSESCARAVMARKDCPSACSIAALMSMILVRAAGQRLGKWF